MSQYPFPLAEPGDTGRPPRWPEPWQVPAIEARRLEALSRRPRRLAVVDSHFPWLVSGFRYHEAEEILRRRPDTLFFSLYRLTDPFPTVVQALERFPTLAAASGVTDIYMVFLNLAAGILGLEGRSGFPGVPGARSDISLRPTLDRWNIRSHVTLYPGGGLFPHTDPAVLVELGRSCASVFTSVPAVKAAIPEAMDTVVPVPGDFYCWRDRPAGESLRLVFVGDDRPRKGMSTLIDALADLGTGFRLDVVGPQDRHATRLAGFGARCHGWLEPDQLREVLWASDVVVSPATWDRPEDGVDIETGMVDGFPTTAARDAMLSGCCLVGSNPLADYSLLSPGRDYIDVAERQPGALVDALWALRRDPARRQRIAASGARVLRDRCDVSVVVGAKLDRMGLGTAPERVAETGA